jgi:hypothetical protein
VAARPRGNSSWNQKYERVSTMDAVTEKLGRRRRRRQADRRRRERPGADGEHTYGLEGSRVLSLSLGGRSGFFRSHRGLPERPWVAAGCVQRDENGPVPRTSAALEARRLSLEKTRDGLAQLRAERGRTFGPDNPGDPDIEIEGQIQELGVSLGDFSERNSFLHRNT